MASILRLRARVAETSEEARATSANSTPTSCPRGPTVSRQPRFPASPARKSATSRLNSSVCSTAGAWPQRPKTCRRTSGSCARSGIAERWSGVIRSWAPWTRRTGAESRRAGRGEAQVADPAVAGGGKERGERLLPGQHRVVPGVDRGVGDERRVEEEQPQQLAGRVPAGTRPPTAHRGPGGSGICAPIAPTPTTRVTASGRAAARDSATAAPMEWPTTAYRSMPSASMRPAACAVHSSSRPRRSPGTGVAPKPAWSGTTRRWRPPAPRTTVRQPDAPVVPGPDPCSSSTGGPEPRSRAHTGDPPTSNAPSAEHGAEGAFVTTAEGTPPVALKPGRRPGRAAP